MGLDTAAIRTIHQAVAAQINALENRGGLLVAYSGGIDSTVLLSALVELGIGPLRVLHVVHNLRPEQELARERHVIQSYCAELHVPLRIAAIKPGSIQKMSVQKRIGIEAAARKLRYGILVREAKRLHCGTICTAHNADDQLETLIGRFIGSSSFEGLRGIPDRRRIDQNIQLIRPLLSIPRSTIEAYALQKALKISQDSTNDSTVYTRNKIRKYLVPVLDREFKGWRKGLKSTAERLSLDSEALSRLLRENYTKIQFSRKDNTASLRLKDFLNLSESLRVRLLTRCLQKLSGKNRISHRAVRESVRAVASGANACDLLEYRVIIKQELLQILPILDFHGEGGYFFNVDADGTYRAGSLRVSCFWDVPGGDGDSCESSLQTMPGLKETTFSFPLAVRSRKPGDKIHSGGKDCRVDELLSSWGIEGRHRDMVPLVEDRDGVVAVLATALEGLGYTQYKFRDYSGPLTGRSFVIRIKGAYF